MATPIGCAISKQRQRMLQTFDRLLLAVNRWLVIALLAAMATMVFANVGLRFLTDHSILWVEEASRYAMVWLTFIGAGPVLRYGGHLGIDPRPERHGVFDAAARIERALSSPRGRNFVGAPA